MPALVYPSNFPPTDRWKKFFVGVRWLGPDLRFFKALKAEQAARDERCMRTWGEGRRAQMASAISRELATQLGWKAPNFIPEDQAKVAFRGPSFDFSDPEDAVVAITQLLESEFGLSVPASFWAAHWHLTLGEVVDTLASLEPFSPSQSRVI